MGINDRDYSRDEGRRTGFLSPGLTPVVKGLLGINIGVFLFDLLLRTTDGRLLIHDFAVFNIRSAIFEFRFWEFFTFQFVHENLGHLFFNSLAIFFFGPWMERWWGSLKFLAFYLLCGTSAAVLYIALVFSGLLVDANNYLIGPSAAIFGVITGVAVVRPDLQVGLLIPPVVLTMRQLAFGVLGISLLMMFFTPGNNNPDNIIKGELCHFAGALAGFLLVRYPRVLKKAGLRSLPRPSSKSSARKSRTSAPKGPSKLRPRSELEKQQDTAVDIILDKISREGFQSLTQEERDFLHKASQSSK